MPRKKIEPSTTTAVPAHATRGTIDSQISDLLRTLMSTLGSAYAEYDTPPAVAEHLEQAKASVLEARKAAHTSPAVAKAAVLEPRKSATA
jgi:hypothetical protein